MGSSRPRSPGRGDPGRKEMLLPTVYAFAHIAGNRLYYLSHILLHTISCIIAIILYYINNLLSILCWIVLCVVLCVVCWVLGVGCWVSGVVCRSVRQKILMLAGAAFFLLARSNELSEHASEASSL